MDMTSITDYINFHFNYLGESTREVDEVETALEAVNAKDGERSQLLVASIWTMTPRRAAEIITNDCGEITDPGEQVFADFVNAIET